MQNVVTIDQLINLCLLSAMLVLAIGVKRHVPSAKGFALAVISIAFVNLFFYVVIVLTSINEADRILFAIVSGIRSAFTYTVMCIMCIMWLKLSIGSKS
jgi:hypothetical protein